MISGNYCQLTCGNCPASCGGGAASPPAANGAAAASGTTGSPPPAANGTATNSGQTGPPPPAANGTATNSGQTGPPPPAASTPPSGLHSNFLKIKWLHPVLPAICLSAAAKDCSDLPVKVAAVNRRLTENLWYMQGHRRQQARLLLLLLRHLECQQHLEAWRHIPSILRRQLLGLPLHPQEVQTAAQTHHLMGNPAVPW